MKRLQGFTALLLATAIFGSMGVLVRYLNYDLTVYQQIIFRNILALIIAVAIILLTKKKIDFKAVPKKYLFLFTFAFPLSVLCFTFSVLYTKIIVTTMSLYVSSLVGSLIIGSVFFKDKLTRSKMIALGTIAIGLIVYAYPFSVAQLNVGFWMGLAAGGFDAIANSFRRHLAGKMDRLVLACLPIIGGAILSVSLLMYTGQSFFPHISTLSWLIGIMFGFFVLSISYLTLVGFQKFDLSLGTVVLSSELFLFFKKNRLYKR